MPVLHLLLSVLFIIVAQAFLSVFLKILSQAGLPVVHLLLSVLLLMIVAATFRLRGFMSFIRRLKPATTISLSQAKACDYHISLSQAKACGYQISLPFLSQANACDLQLCFQATGLL
ncbi:MAG: hypothetical protein ACK40E_04795 [Caldimicrobium sp.]